MPRAGEPDALGAEGTAVKGAPVFGVLRDRTGSRTLPLALLLGVTACLLAAGLGDARDARLGAPAGAGDEQG